MFSHHILLRGSARLLAVITIVRLVLAPLLTVLNTPLASRPLGGGAGGILSRMFCARVTLADVSGLWVTRDLARVVVGRCKVTGTVLAGPDFALAPEIASALSGLFHF